MPAIPVTLNKPIQLSLLVMSELRRKSSAFVSVRAFNIASKLVTNSSASSRFSFHCVNVRQVLFVHPCWDFISSILQKNQDLAHTIEHSSFSQMPCKMDSLLNVGAIFLHRSTIHCRHVENKFKPTAKFAKFDFMARSCTSRIGSRYLVRNKFVYIRSILEYFSQSTERDELFERQHRMLSLSVLLH
jgi:hypothetical protein